MCFGRGGDHVYGKLTFGGREERGSDPSSLLPIVPAVKGRDTKRKKGKEQANKIRLKILGGKGCSRKGFKNPVGEEQDVPKGFYAKERMEKEQEEVCGGDVHAGSSKNSRKLL